MIRRAAVALALVAAGCGGSITPNVLPLPDAPNSTVIPFPSAPGGSARTAASSAPAPDTSTPPPPSAFKLQGPDAATIYGLAAGAYPRATRERWWEPAYLVDAQSRMDELFPSHRVAKAATPRPLRRGSEIALTFHPAGQTQTLDTYLARNPATGLLILRGDTILFERYQYGRRDTHRFASWSMAKTVTSMLIGIAIAEGKIRSLDDLPSAYVPALEGSPYGATPLRHLLTMSSGVKFREDYSGDDDSTRLAIDTFLERSAGGAAAVTRYTEREAEPGTRFSYASAETQVLGLVLRAAIGRPVADYLSEQIWQPMGAESDATWLIDKAGQESTYCCLNAVLRDYGRLGLVLANGGRVGDRQVIPAAWITEATTAPSPYLAPWVATRFFGYGYQTWIFPEARGFALLGIRGQVVYVDPASQLVMVQTAVRPIEDARARETVGLWYALREAYGR